MSKHLAFLFPILLALVGQAGIALGLHVWARWVGRRHRLPWWRRSAWLPVIAFVLTVVGVATAVVYLLLAFDAVNAVTPTLKATIVARNISRAVNVSAALSFPAWALYAVSVVTSLVGSMLRRSL